MGYNLVKLGQFLPSASLEAPSEKQPRWVRMARKYTRWVGIAYRLDFGILMRLKIKHDSLSHVNTLKYFNTSHSQDHQITPLEVGAEDAVLVYLSSYSDANDALLLPGALRN